MPLIVRWSGVVEAGTESDEPVISTDWYPTLLAVAGQKPEATQPLDGDDITPLLEGRKKLERDAIYFHFPNYAWHGANRLGGAIRSGRYKLIERFDNGELELFDLDADLSEEQNLAKEMPELAARLQKRLAAWRQDTNAAMPVARK